jgi:ubiquitin-protein ligase
MQPSGTISDAKLNECQEWRPYMTIKQILTNLQDFLTSPNPKSPAQREAYELYVSKPAEYQRRVKEQAMAARPPLAASSATSSSPSLSMSTPPMNNDSVVVGAGASGDGISTARLSEERKNWRKDHPTGFYARPMRKSDGSNDIMTWEAGIPGKAGTDWEGGVYKIVMEFCDDYPQKVRGL